MPCLSQNTPRQKWNKKFDHTIKNLDLAYNYLNDMQLTLLKTSHGPPIILFSSRFVNNRLFFLRLFAKHRVMGFLHFFRTLYSSISSYLSHFQCKILSIHCHNTKTHSNQHLDYKITRLGRFHWILLVIRYLWLLNLI